MVADFKTGTSLLGKILASGQVATSGADTTIYTVPALSAVKIASFALINISGSAVTVTCSVVPNGGTVDTTHRVISAYSLASGDSTLVMEVVGGMLDAGAFISLNCSAGTSINYLLTGAVSS